MEGRRVRGRISAMCPVRKKASSDMAGRFLEDWDGGDRSDRDAGPGVMGEEDF